MDKEQKKRMASRTVIQQDEGQGDIEYTIQVSGDRVEIHQDYDAEWDDEDGTGPDIQHECWVMNKDVLKNLIEAAQWCIEKSEAFEAAHPSLYQVEDESEGEVLGDLDDHPFSGTEALEPSPYGTGSQMIE